MYAFIKGRCLANMETILCGSVLSFWILPISSNRRILKSRFLPELTPKLSGLETSSPMVSWSDQKEIVYLRLEAISYAQYKETYTLKIICYYLQVM